MANVKGKVRRLLRRVRRGVASFKRRNPRVYKGIRKYGPGLAASALGVAPEYALARGLYKAYKGRNRGIRWQAKNAARTALNYGWSQFTRSNGGPVRSDGYTRGW